MPILFPSERPIGVKYSGIEYLTGWKRNVITTTGKNMWFRDSWPIDCIRSCKDGRISANFGKIKVGQYNTMRIKLREKIKELKSTAPILVHDLITNLIYLNRLMV